MQAITSTFMQAITNILNFSGRSILTVFKGDFHYTIANHMHSCSQFKTNAMNLCLYRTRRQADKNGKMLKKKKSEKYCCYRERTQEFLPRKTK